MRIRGTVKWFNETKGYGFLRRDDGQSDCFVHHSEIQSQGYRTLQEGERVEFDVVQQPKGPKASNVVKLDEADAAADTAAADAGTPDTGTPDTGTPDTGTPDTGTAYAGAADTGAADTAAADTGGGEEFGGGETGFAAESDSEE